MRRYILLTVVCLLTIACSVMLVEAASTTQNPVSTAITNTPPPDGGVGGQGSAGFSNAPNGLISQSQFNTDLTFLPLS